MLQKLKIEKLIITIFKLADYTVADLSIKLCIKGESSKCKILAKQTGRKVNYFVIVTQHTTALKCDLCFLHSTKVGRGAVLSTWGAVSGDSAIQVGS